MSLRKYAEGEMRMMQKYDRGVAPDSNTGCCFYSLRYVLGQQESSNDVSLLILTNTISDR